MHCGARGALQARSVPSAHGPAVPLSFFPLCLTSDSGRSTVVRAAPPRIAPVYVSGLQRVISEGPDVASAATGPLPGGLRLGRLQERKGEGEGAGALQIRPKVGWTCLVAGYGVVRRYEWDGRYWVYLLLPPHTCGVQQVLYGAERSGPYITVRLFLWKGREQEDRAVAARASASTTFYSRRRQETASAGNGGVSGRPRRSSAHSISHD